MNTANLLVLRRGHRFHGLPARRNPGHSGPPHRSRRRSGRTFGAQPEPVYLNDKESSFPEELPIRMILIANGSAHWNNWTRSPVSIERPPMSITGPPVARLQLGRLLRDMRESCGKTQEQAANALECTKPKISKIETGKATIGPGDVRLLIDCYGVPGEHAETVLQLARQARKRNHIRVPDWAQRFVAMESIAATLCAYESELVPALFRTPEYAKAVALAVDPRRDPDELERLVTVNTDRQALLAREEPPVVAVVLNETVLRRPVGGCAVMHKQLAHLRDLTERPNITVQVLPFGAGAHAAMGTSFQLLHYEQPAPGRLVYLEHLSNADYLDGPAQTEWYDTAFARLRAASLSPGDTATLLDEIR
ncbi:helix-turn-helix transcriptional regulator [Saccharopolyspora sp. NPDC047091]|uniref:helix-turn-helix domain-containing protein n=1 Tax=Saccharopolyspora sp. NPDC047091 TaxID=3155924 RepID=UPI0033F6C53E